MGLFEVGYSSAAHSPAQWRKMCQLAVQTGPATSTGIDRRWRRTHVHARTDETPGVNTIAFTATSPEYALYKRFHRRQKPQTPPLYARICLKAQHGTITSSTIHPSIIHWSVRPPHHIRSLRFSFFPSSSVASVGPVQSESLAELRLSLGLSPKAASFI